MRRFAFLLYTAFAACILLAHPVAAQVTPTRQDIVPIQSGIYKQTMNVFVHSSNAATASSESLPVVYIPNIRKQDSAYYTRLRQLMQEGSMPQMRIVGIEYTLPEAAGQAVESQDYVNPKDKGELQLSAEESYYRFINTEVIPAIEGKYNCSPFKALCLEEGSGFADYMLKNHSSQFNAFINLTPFVWFNVRRQPETAKAFLAYIAGLTSKDAVPAPGDDSGAVDEHFLKTGRPGWVKEL